MTAYNSAKACSRRIKELEIEVKKLREENADHAAIFQRQASIKFFKARRERLAKQKTRNRMEDVS